MKKSSKTFLTFAIACCLGNAFFSIVSLALSAIALSGNAEISTTEIYSELISLGINVLFYVLVAFEFKKAKNGNKSYANTAVLTLALCQFIIPLFTSFVYNLLFAGIASALISLVLVGLITIFGVIYSIFLLLDLRNHKKVYVIVMKVFGVFLLIVGLVDFVYSANIIIEEIKLLFSSQIETTFTLTLVTYIVSLIVSFIDLGFYIIYFYFPFYLSKNRS